MNQSGLQNLSSGTEDIRLLLQSELVRRCKVNPRYSARAFARALNMEASALSKVLRGERAVTKSSFGKVSKALSLSPSQISQLANSVKERRGKGKTQEIQVTPTYSYEQISQDQFQLIADWYHYAILEFTTVQGFQSNAKWVAKKLGLSVTEVNIAVDRLKRLNLLKVSAEGKWVDVSLNATNIEGTHTSSARKQLQKDILNLALIAIDEVPFEKRDNSSMTMAIDSELMPEAKKMIMEFRRSLCDLLQRSQKRDAVYQLSVALIPATKSYNNKGDER